MEVIYDENTLKEYVAKAVGVTPDRPLLIDRSWKNAWEREPVKGIHMSFDAEISDVQDYEHRCNTYYKAGVGVDVLPIEEAIEHL